MTDAGPILHSDWVIFAVWFCFITSTPSPLPEIAVHMHECMGFQFPQKAEYTLHVWSFTSSYGEADSDQRKIPFLMAGLSLVCQLGICCGLSWSFFCNLYIFMGSYIILNDRNYLNYNSILTAFILLYKGEN